MATRSKFMCRTETKETHRRQIIVDIPRLIQLGLKEGFTSPTTGDDFISMVYWLLDISNDDNVEYVQLIEDTKAEAITKKGQQCTAYGALITMIGFVKEITNQNADAGLKRWKAGLASQSIPDLLEDSHKKTLDEREFNLPNACYKSCLYTTGTLYDLAYLKSVQCMYEFILSGNHALSLPNVRKDAKTFKEVFDRVKTIEGLNFPLCRLIDNNKHPDLNHSKYPELYAVTLQWARKTKKVQKNYVGSKSIVERSMDLDLARKLIGIRGIKGLPSISAEDKEWIASVGCNINEEEVNKALKKITKRAPVISDSEESGSEEEESDEEEGSKKKRRRKTTMDYLILADYLITLIETPLEYRTLY
ncbi:unnamed protein product, partial [Brenthis ino]